MVFQKIDGMKRVSVGKITTYGPYLKWVYQSFSLVFQNRLSDGFLKKKPHPKMRFAE